MHIDLERLPYPEWLALEARVHRAKLIARERERKALAIRVREMCCAYGLTPDQMFGMGQRRKKKAGR